jgi:hypothetical protein
VGVSVMSIYWGNHTIQASLDGYQTKTEQVTIAVGEKKFLEILLTPDDCFVESLFGRDSREAELLRDFRDNILINFPFGLKLIDFYCQLNPYLLKLISK